MKETIRTEKAPAAIGPYSQGVKANGFIFVSGQIALDPATGGLVGNEVRGQAEQVLKNLQEILDAAGSSLERVVKTTVFLADLNDFAALNEVYARFFPTDPPARATVEVRRLPRDVRVEIDLIAVVAT